jgi:hypothetical protein
MFGRMHTIFEGNHHFPGTSKYPYYREIKRWACVFVPVLMNAILSAECDVARDQNVAQRMLLPDECADGCYSIESSIHKLSVGRSKSGRRRG